jgi:hypothetical protein
MSNSLQSPETEIVDICLLLRAHGEQLWLQTRVLPLVCKLEQREPLCDEQLGAALAYLEVMWIEARSRAIESDAALARAQPSPSSATGTLRERARRYHAAVRRLRASLGARVAELLAVPDEHSAVEHASR